MSESSEFGKLCFTTFRKFHEKISAFYYHKGKIAIAFASTYQRIEVWNYKSNKRELAINTDGLVSRCLKFDDDILMSMFEEIKSWDLPSGKSNIVYKGSLFRCSSFDFCKELNIVVGSFSNSSIYIWNLSTGEEVKLIENDHGLVQKVYVYPLHSEVPQEMNMFHLLVLKDKKVDMWTYSGFNLSDELKSEIRAVDYSTADHFFENLSSSAIQTKIVGSRFISKFLYYIESSDILHKSSIIEWNMRTNLLQEKFEVNGTIKNLLAVGNKYIAFQTEFPNSGDIFVVIDGNSHAKVTASKLPNDLQSIGADGYPPVIMGETTWLDGLNEQNKDDILCLCVCNRQEIQVLKRGQSDPEPVIESTSNCNLL